MSASADVGTKVTVMSTFCLRVSRDWFSTALEKKMKPITKSVTVIISTDAKETVPFRQKFMNPVRAILLKLVQNMLLVYLGLYKIFALFVVAYDLALLHHYHPLAQGIYNTLIVSGED